MSTHHFDDKRANLKVLLSAIGAKEVNCRVKLTIHTVTNLPVLDGAFRVRWKFRDIDSKAVKQQKKEYDQNVAINLGLAHQDPERPPANHSSSTDSSSLLLTGLTTESSHSTASSSAPGPQKPVNFSADERGSTPYRNLRKDHAVPFDHTVEVVASMRLVKGELIGEPLKLVIERRMDDSETIGLSRKFEPRIGHKYIDLAEFVNEGKVRRKFLLERSKTNAMVTISLDIATTKTGIEFRKPALRQDHLLIGRKEPVRPPRRDIPLIKTGSAPKPSLTRNSSTTSSSASSVSYKHSVAPPRSETEAVIEALFNPTIFKSSPATTPYTSSPSPRTAGARKFEEALTPRPREGRRQSTGDDESEGVDSDAPESHHSTKRSSTSGSHSGSLSQDRHRRPSIHGQQKTALDIALDMNQRKDRERTIRPILQNGESWEFVDFKGGAQGVKRVPYRSNTGDSNITDHSTSSKASFASNSSGPKPLVASPQTTSGRTGLPSINIMGKLRKGSANDVSSGHEIHHPLGRRATAPAPGRGGGGGIAAALASAGKMSMDIGGRLGSLDLGSPEAAAQTLGVRKSLDTSDGVLASGQVTPTPEAVGEKNQAALVHV